MVLLGTVRKLSQFKQRFHNQFLLPAKKFESGTFLCSNLVDSKLTLLLSKNWNTKMRFAIERKCNRLTVLPALQQVDGATTAAGGHCGARAARSEMV